LAAAMLEEAHQAVDAMLVGGRLGASGADGIEYLEGEGDFIVGSG
jgi:hypothetical protein